LLPIVHRRREVLVHVPAKIRSTVDKIGGIGSPAFDSALQQESACDSIVVYNINNSRSLHRSMKTRKGKSPVAGVLEIGF
jgi:hypothetical protein